MINSTNNDMENEKTNTHMSHHCHIIKESDKSLKLMWD